MDTRLAAVLKNSDGWEILIAELELRKKTHESVLGETIVDYDKWIMKATRANGVINELDAMIAELKEMQNQSLDHQPSISPLGS